MKLISRATICSLFLAFAALVGGPLRAEEPKSEAPRLEEIARELNLTDEQKAAIAPILRQQAEELKALQADATVRRMQKLKRAKQINEKASTAIRAHLDPEQQKKYEELRAEVRKEMKSRLKERQAQSSGS